jgi:hypothetical protein
MEPKPDNDQQPFISPQSNPSNLPPDTDDFIGRLLADTSGFFEQPASSVPVTPPNQPNSTTPPYQPNTWPTLGSNLTPKPPTYQPFPMPNPESESKSPTDIIPPRIEGLIEPKLEASSQNQFYPNYNTPPPPQSIYISMQKYAIFMGIMILSIVVSCAITLPMILYNSALFLIGPLLFTGGAYFMNKWLIRMWFVNRREWNGFVRKVIAITWVLAMLVCFVIWQLYSNNGSSYASGYAIVVAGILAMAFSFFVVVYSVVCYFAGRSLPI